MTSSPYGAAPSCPECGEEMVVRTARKGRNAGNQFWGCPQWPECEGTQPVGGPGVGQTKKSNEDPPECPLCGGPMVLRTAEKGESAGEEFWGCEDFPRCRGSRSKGEPEGSHHDTEETARRHRRPVTWRDGTMGRPGWRCRYTTIGASIRAVPGAQGIATSLSQAWIAVSEDGSREATGGGPFTQVLRKILQRGPAPPIHPLAERRLLDELGWDDRVRPSSLPGDLGLEATSSVILPDIRDLSLWITEDFKASEHLEFDSREEESFLREWVPSNLGASAARWFIPQAPLDTILRGSGGETRGERRVDFLAVPPGFDPFVVEIDGAQHDDADQVDDARDAQLEEIGLSVLRVPASEIRAGNGPALSAVARCWSRRSDPPSSEIERLLLSPIHVHRLAFALTEGIERGYLAGDRWVVHVEDDIGDAVRLFPPYLELFEALDRIWEAEVVPDEVVVGDGQTWMMLRRSDAGYESMPTARGTPEPGDVSLRVRLEGRKSANDVLGSSSRDIPEIVVRSACLPVRLSVAEPIGSRRRLPDVPEGERGDRALRAVLRGVFGKDEFREGQLQSVRQILAGHDCAVLLPTGAGKSLVYQLAGLCTPGVTLIVDPIVALMEDQLESLDTFGVERAISISSHTVQQGLRDVLLDSVASGEALFVFIAPERLQQQQFRGSVRTAAQASPVNLAVIDEAHCVSEWGHDFRTSYLNLGRILRRVARDTHDESPPLLALTGTASRAILNDMLVELDIDPGVPGTVVKPETFDRPELNFTIVRVEPEEARPTLRGQLANLPARFDEDRANFFRPRGRRTKSGIVFCPHVNGDYGIIKVAESLTAMTGTQAVTYSGSSPRGISPRNWENRKRENAEAFRKNEAPLLVSTKAFGMGIDKPNIRYVVHYGIPGSIEGYYQEAGRAGRDRKQAECILVLIEFDEARARRLLSEEATLEEMREERKEISRSASDDISRQLYFHLSSFPGIEEELETLGSVLEDLGDVGRRRRQEIVFEKDDTGREARERALHRLVILGAVRDYLVDWGAKKFDAKLEKVESEEVVENALSYVRRSQPGRYQAEREKLDPLRSESVEEAILGTAEELIRFIYQTIERSRRRSLREMWLAARETAQSPKVDFRERILDYLTEGELVPRLEKLIDLDEFFFSDWVPFFEDVANPEEARELRGSTGRLLGSYPDHPGLLAARALSEIEMPDGNLREYYRNLDDALDAAVERYGSTEQELQIFGRWVIERCDLLSAHRPLTATVALLEDHDIATDTVAEIEREALGGDRSDPGLRVLALTRSLEVFNEELARIPYMESGDTR